MSVSFALHVAVHTRVHGKQKGAWEEVTDTFFHMSDSEVMEVALDRDGDYLLSLWRWV